MVKPISISLSPNTEKDDVWLAFKLKFSPWLWKEGKGPNQLEEEFKRYFNVKYAFAFNSGRSAFLAILESLGLKSREEIIVQAFTCNAVSNPIIWAGLKPVYDDVSEQTYNIDPEAIEKKITDKSRAVVVQHTFGLAADMDKILDICRKHNLVLIEDCAHSLGGSYKERKLGTFGKAAFFSFSRDKVISSVYGGMAITDDDQLAEKIKMYQSNIGYPSYLWIGQQLLHPILMNWLILPTYAFLGKFLLVIFQWLNILSKAVHWKEKRGQKPGYFPKRMPNALALLALNQFKKLDRFNEHRKEIANYYFQNLKNSSFKLPEMAGDQEHVFLRFTVRHPKAHLIIKDAWKKNILIGDWYTTAIAPYDTKMEKVEYYSGLCPQAEKLAQDTLNLPTHINISINEAKIIVDFLKQYDS